MLPTPKLRSLLVCTIALLATATAAAQNTIHVPADQPTIQAGINAANTGDTVLVAPGTYYENIDFKGKAILVTSTPGPAGGPNNTVLDGSKGIGPAANFTNSEPRTAILNGFTVQNAGVEASSGSVPAIGGIYIGAASPTISNNIITHNHCNGIESNGAPLIQNNEIDNTLDSSFCSVAGGVAVYIENAILFSTSNPSAVPVIVGNLIQNNTQAGHEDAGGEGGAGIAVVGETAIIEDNVIRNNSTDAIGAGIHLETGSSALIVDNLIYNNQAGGGGGGMDYDSFFVNDGVYPTFNVFVANNTFVNNTYSGPVSGVLNDNEVDQIFLGPDSFVAPTAAFVNNIVAGNSHLPAVQCGLQRQGMPVDDTLDFDHNLFFNSGGPIFGSHCSNHTGTFGNLDADPKFLDPTTNNFHLSTDSPALDAGNNGALAVLATNGVTVTTDIDGNPRLQDAKGKGYPTIDIGAYEGLFNTVGISENNATTILLSPSAFQAPAGQTVTFTVKAFSPLGTPSGPIALTEDGASVAVTNLDGVGNATFLPNVGPGLHHFVATYPGKGSFSPGFSVQIIVIFSNYQPSMTLVSSASPSIFMQTITVTATISSADTNQLGPISLTDAFDSSTLATLTPNAAGVATYTTNGLASGSHLLTATYNGDATHNSVSAILDQIVNVNIVAAPTATTTLAITAGGSPVSTVPAGTVVTLTATTLAGTSPISPGQVNFCDATAPNCLGLNLIGTAQLTPAGAAALKFVARAGTHSYNAVFLGTSTNTTSSSAAQPLTVTVTSSPGTITLADTGVPGNYTLTATVTGSAATTPTGTVSFLDTTNANYLLGSATLSTGTSGLIWTASTIPTNVSPGSLVAADFNNDGYADLALTTRDSVSILNGNGNGEFPRTTTVAVGHAPGYLAVADFNGDGTPDLAISNQSDGSVTILTSSGNGFDVFAPIPVGLNVEAITTGDFNHDGNADFAVIYNENSIAVFLGKGDGTFTPIAAHPTTDVEPTSIVTGDFNGDGNLDLILSNAIGSGPTVNGNLTVLLGNGDGTFTPAASPSTGVNPESIAVGDFNNDGKLDLAVANYTSNTVTILLGNGDGTFSSSSVAAGAAPWSVSVADFNGDGIPDLLVVPAVGATAATTILIGKGDGTFSAITGPSTGNAPLYGVIADFNSDGVPDFAISNAADSTLGLFLTQTASTSTAVVDNISPVGTGPHLVDATYGGSTSNTVSLTAQRVPTTLALTATAAPSGGPIALAAAISPNTAQNHSAGGSVTFFDNGNTLGTGTVSGGVATLPVASFPAGLNNLSAQYSGDTNFAPSSGTGSITIAPAPPADFTFIGPPTVTFRTESTGVATLSLASLNGFAAPIAITCNSPLPPNYLCTLSNSTVPLAANNTASLTLTLHPNLNASLTFPPRPFPSKTAVALASLLPLTLLSLFRRRRRNPLHRLLLLVCLAAAATALTACGSDIDYPATPPGLYPITITATGTSQGASASTTHTLLLNANITP